MCGMQKFTAPMAARMKRELQIAIVSVELAGRNNSSVGDRLRRNLH